MNGFPIRYMALSWRKLRLRLGLDWDLELETTAGWPVSDGLTPQAPFAVAL